MRVDRRPARLALGVSQRPPPLVVLRAGGNLAAQVDRGQQATLILCVFVDSAQAGLVAVDCRGLAAARQAVELLANHVAADIGHTQDA